MTDIQHLRELIKEQKYYLYPVDWPRMEFYRQHGRWSSKDDWTLAKLQEQTCAMVESN